LPVFGGGDAGGRNTGRDAMPVRACARGYAHMACFWEGTLISTPDGARAIETLAIGDQVRTEDGRDVPIVWIGIQAIQTDFARERASPVCIRAGALGDGLPNADLYVTSDHGIILDGLIVNAGALINNHSVHWVGTLYLPDSFTLYHVETEAHEVILANGAAAETYWEDGRRAFDNFQDYLDRYGAERRVIENPMPRVSAARLLPKALKERLGLPDKPPSFDPLRSMLDTL